MSSSRTYGSESSTADIHLLKVMLPVRRLKVVGGPCLPALILTNRKIFGIIEYLNLNSTCISTEEAKSGKFGYYLQHEQYHMAWRSAQKSLSWYVESLDGWFLRWTVSTPKTFKIISKQDGRTPGCGKVALRISAKPRQRAILHQLADQVLPWSSWFRELIWIHLRIKYLNWQSLFGLKTKTGTALLIFWQRLITWKPQRITPVNCKYTSLSELELFSMLPYQTDRFWSDIHETACLW